MNLVLELALADSRRDASYPMSLFRGFPLSHPHRIALQRMNILLRQVCGRDDDIRHYVASEIYERKIVTLNQLRVSEVYAFLDAAYPVTGNAVDEQFLSHLISLTEKYHEQAQPF